MRKWTLLALLAAAPVSAADEYLPWEGGPQYYRKWSNGLRSDNAFFPIAVWLQSPDTAAQYKAIGVNVFVGLWRGPTEEQLKKLTEAGMTVIAGRPRGSRSIPGDSIIRGWMHNDEPDNAQAKPGGGWGSCILPPVVVEGYRAMKAADETRPIYLNLGQAIANRTWPGRGDICGGHDEHYPEYIRGADIVSYDVYPVNSKVPLYYVADGIDRLRKWANYEKPVWNWIETTAIRGGTKPTPAQIRAEVWLSIVHGSMGVGYFCHQFRPTEDAAAPLHDAETRQALASIDEQVTALAPVLNTRPVGNGVKVSSEAQIDTMLKRHGGATYLFAVSRGEGTARFDLRDCGDVAATVLAESRTVRVKRGRFEDRFGEYQVHIYKLPFDPNRR